MAIAPDELYEKQRESLLPYEDARFSSLMAGVADCYSSTTDLTLWGSVLRVVAQELARIEYAYSYDVVTVDPTYLTPPDIKRQYAAPLQINKSYPEQSQFDLDYRNMLVALLKAYPEGTTVDAIQKVIQAYTGQVVEVLELYTLIGNGLYDESDRNTIKVSLSTQGVKPLSQLESANLLPSSQAYTGLMGAGVAPTSRYIKVTYNNSVKDVVMIEGRDFTLSVDPVSGAASLTRTIGRSIPSGASVKVTYYTLEVLSIQTEYPSFVQQLVSSVSQTKHAGADVLVKAMVPTAVDTIVNVQLNSATTPEAVDGRLRTAYSLVMDKADTKLFQDAIVAALRAIPGVVSIPLPLLKCAKSDGSYNIGHVIPTGTGWMALRDDAMFANVIPPANTFISEDVLLPDPTIPSGGPSNAYVGLLYEGQSYRRALSIDDFLNGPQPSFYVIGTNDEITAALPLTSPYAGKLLLSTPPDQTDPSLRAYRLTYQVYGAASSNDITVASSEYLVPGSLQINYLEA